MSEPKVSDIVIGIDLGTTNSCAAYYYDGNIKILENDGGERTTPSIVYFTESEPPTVGHYAKRRSLANPKLAVAEIKRLIGRPKNDPYVQENLKYYPFELDPDSDEATILIKHKNTVTKKSPSSISALILLKIKNDVEVKLGCGISKAVITVPAYFNVNQREETLKAAEKAGFQVLKLLNEPTAAALSYFHDKKSYQNAEKYYSLVFDLGGGTFDVAVIKKNEENIEVICVDGDSHLGGHDFDQKIFDFVCDEVRNKCNFDIQNNTKSTRRLLNMCEDAKKDLSNPNSTKVQIDLFGVVSEDNITHISITKKKFENLITSYIDRTIQIVDNCLKTSKLSKDDIAEIILAGGSTRIPKIQETLSKYFNNRQLNKFVNPDECVAEGAALQAALLSKNLKQQVESIQISEVIPLSLGISELCNRMSVIIPRNSKIPTTKSVPFVNSFDQQTTMVFNIYEGERLNVKKNRYLATLTIDNLTPAPPEQCEVVLKMSIDNNGILKVTAQEKYKTNVKDLKTTYAKVDNNETGSKHDIQSNEKYEEEDKKFDKFTIRKTYLLDYCSHFCCELKQKKLIRTHEDLYDLCNDVQRKTIDLDIEDESRIQEFTKTVTQKCEPIVSSNNFNSMPTVPPQVLNESVEKTEVHHNKKFPDERIGNKAVMSELEQKLQMRRNKM